MNIASGIKVRFFLVNHGVAATQNEAVVREGLAPPFAWEERGGGLAGGLFLGSDAERGEMGAVIQDVA